MFWFVLSGHQNVTGKELFATNVAFGAVSISCPFDVVGLMWNVIVSVPYHCQFPFIPVGIINITKGPTNTSFIKRQSIILFITIDRLHIEL